MGAKPVGMKKAAEVAVQDPVSHGRAPAAVHVDRDASSAKFWLKPVGVAWSSGFAPHELARIERIVRDHVGEFLEAWNEHLG